MNTEVISALAADFGFDFSYIVPASLTKDAPPGCETLLLLLQGYHGERLPSGEWAAIHPYYFASQRAYQQTQAMVKRLNELGIAGRQAPEFRLGPLCRRLTPFWQGRNTLFYHKALGSRFHIQVIALEKGLPWEASLLRTGEREDRCGSCQRCLKACPAGAITLAGVDGQRCLRQHMLTGPGTPAAFRALMKNRLVGCDNCQAACPYNQPPGPAQPGSQVALAALLPPEKSFCQALAQAIGPNLAIANRLCAQACVIAGNSGLTALAPKLAALSTHPSPGVAGQASWAAERIKQASEGGIEIGALASAPPVCYACTEKGGGSH